MTTQEMIEVMQAYEDGKEIEFKWKGKDIWRGIEHPAWYWNGCDYRIKPEPKYGPYDSVTEIDRDKWVKGKASGVLYRIILLDPDDNSVQLSYGLVSLQEFFTDYTYEDGTPCGKLVEE